MNVANMEMLPITNTSYQLSPRNAPVSELENGNIGTGNISTMLFPDYNEWDSPETADNAYASQKTHCHNNGGGTIIHMKPGLVSSVLAFSFLVALLLKMVKRQVLAVFAILLPAFVFMVANLDETNPMFAIWGLLFLIFSVGIMVSDLREKGYHSVLIKFNPFVENSLLPKWLKIALLFLAIVFGLLNAVRSITALGSAQ